MLCDAKNLSTFPCPSKLIFKVKTSQEDLFFWTEWIRSTHLLGLLLWFLFLLLLGRLSSSMQLLELHVWNSTSDVNDMLGHKDKHCHK